MIWLHTYGVGKFGKRIIKTIHESEKDALDSQAVLGGEVKAFIGVEKVDFEMHHLTERVREAVSGVIDEFTVIAPQFYGSSDWDVQKVNAINGVSELMTGEKF